MRRGDLWIFGRTKGKDGWWLPEHFSAEWDHVNYEPYNERFTDVATGAGAAGAFTPKSNIFHAGMVRNNALPQVTLSPGLSSQPTV